MIVFLEKYRHLIFTTLIVIVGIIIAVVIIAELQGRAKEQALVKLFELENEIEEQAQEFSMEDFDMQIDEIAEISRNIYVQSRIQFLVARMYWDNEQYQNAAEHYLQLAQQLPRSHLGQVSFFNAAMAYEQNEEIERAIEILEQILLEYEFATNPLLPRTLLNLGRLYEMIGDTKQASDYYNDLISNYSGNALINLAYNRLILIESNE